MKLLQDLNLEFRESVYMNGPGQWLWPMEDHDCWNYFNNTERNLFANNNKNPYHLPHDIMELLPAEKRNLVLQAGGNGGLYPAIYAGFFKQVVTFEPHYRWFACLSMNAPEDNVFKYRAALGNDNEPIQIVIPNNNMGGMYMQPNGIIPKLKLDAFGLSPDLIHLDIEGAEHQALLGAQETITRSRPMIVLEWDNSTATRFGYSMETLETFFKENNYVLQKSWPRDRAYVHESMHKELA
jgi:FkbM family methyltransferase